MVRYVRNAEGGLSMDMRTWQENVVREQRRETIWRVEGSRSIRMTDQKDREEREYRISEWALSSIMVE